MSVYDETRLNKMFYECFKETPDEYNLYFFLRFYPKDFYYVLKAEHKANIEAVVLKGIANGKLNYMTGKVSGRYSKEATLAAEFMDRFNAKEQIIDAVRQHAVKSSPAQNYAIWYFHDYVRLDKEENLNYYFGILCSKKLLRKTEYTFLHTFIDSKQNKAFKVFREHIERYEKVKNISEEDRIPGTFPF